MICYTVTCNWYSNTCASLLAECILRSSGRSKKYHNFKEMMIFQDPARTSMWYENTDHKVTGAANATEVCGLHSNGRKC